jgi:hypothetical protein
VNTVHGFGSNPQEYGLEVFFTQKNINRSKSDGSN